MDLNTNQSTEINNMNSSVSSIASSFGKLKINSSAGRGPINRLPNELMQLILAKFNLDGNVKKLVRLRLVSTRWKVMVEDYCERKKSLIVHFDKRKIELHHDIVEKSHYSTSYYEQAFFGTANILNIPYMFLRCKMSTECLRSLLNLFPNIVQLSIRFHKQAPVLSEVPFYLNSLGSLKQLHIEGKLDLALRYLSSFLHKLEHFSTDTGLVLCSDDHHLLISHLKAQCVRLNFRKELTFDQIRQWHSINPAWLVNLTHLEVYIHLESEKVVQSFCEQATSLKCLKMTFSNPFVFTPTLIRDLGKLTNLTELEFWSIQIELSELEHAASQFQLTSLSSVLTCKLVTIINYEQGEMICADQFTRVFSRIFPNLVEFCLDIRNEYGRLDTDRQFRLEMEQNLYRFPSLRKHEIYT